jgi:GR25 family glycosyltransferase involved in LPS biosynthesis
MIGLNDVFDKIIWINSKRRADRYRNMTRRLVGLDVEAERMEAVWGGAVNPLEHRIVGTRRLSLPEIGCFLSHRTIYQRMKKEGWQKCLILEDDAEFVEGFTGLFNELYPQVPADWQMLYFGRWNFDRDLRPEPMAEYYGLDEEIYPRLWKADRCWYTHAYAITQDSVDRLLHETECMYHSIDGQLANIQRHLRTYAIHPAIIKQDGTMTSIQLPQ